MTPVFPVEILLSPLSDDSDEGDEHLRLCALCDLCVSDPALDIPSPRVPRGDSSLYPLSDDGDDSDEGDEGDKHLSRYFFTP